MLRSNPNAKSKKWFGTRNKLEIQNKSNYEITYEASHYEEQQILHMENEANLNISGVGVGGGNKIDYSKAQLLNREKDTIPKNTTVNITVEGSKRVLIKYQYIGLHKNLTDAQRNFTVYDEVWFEQPSQETIDRILQENKEEEEEEELQRNIKRKCSTGFPHMCSADDTPKRQCTYCGDWYCNYHYHVNNSMIGAGHNCKGTKWRPLLR